MKEHSEHNKVTRTLLIKNLNNNCCITIVKEVLENNGITVNHIKLGEVKITFDIKKISINRIRELLKEHGFDIISDREKMIVENIKVAVIELIHYASNSNSIIRNSDYLVDKLQFSYQYLSSIFSKHEPVTLEKFIILHKIEKVKELIMEGEFTLSEIAYQMGYSSVQYLSSQFRQVAGVSVSEFKKEPSPYLKSLDDIYNN